MTTNHPTPDWKLICSVDDIPVLGARRVARPAGLDVAVFRNDAGGVFALLDRCPHKGGPLSEGIVAGHTVTCPLHSWVFDLNTGQALGADEGTVATYPARVENGRVLVGSEIIARRPAVVPAA